MKVGRDRMQTNSENVLFCSSLYNCSLKIGLRLVCKEINQALSCVISTVHPLAKEGNIGRVE